MEPHCQLSRQLTQLTPIIDAMSGLEVSDASGPSRIGACLRALNGHVLDVERTRASAAEAQNSLKDALQRLESERKPTAAAKARIKAAYENAIEKSKEEERLLRNALSEIYGVRRIRSEVRIAARNAGNKETIRRGALMKLLATSAETIPLWVASSADQQPPPLCGATEADANYVAQPGDMAAALVRSPDGDENWILAEVIGYNSAAGRYEVDDIDEEQKERHTLTRRKVIPLPTMRACPETNPEALYPTGTTVMAIYPQTTCFYKGLIKEQPATASDDYQVLFEDPSYADGYSPPLNVAQRYIIQVNEKKKSK